MGGLICEELQRSTPRFNAAKTSVLFVTDPGVLAAGIAGECIASIEAQGFGVEVFSDVQPDPPERCVRAAVEHGKRSGVSAVCGFGGGSSLDVAKLAAFFLHQGCQQGLEDVYGVDQCIGDRLPLVQIPTVGSVCVCLLSAVGVDCTRPIADLLLFVFIVYERVERIYTLRYNECYSMARVLVVCERIVGF